MLETYNSRLKEKHKELDQKEEREEESKNLQEEIKDIQNELYHEVEAIDSAKRIKIEIDKKGKNNAYSFIAVKEPKGRKQINKIKIGNDEIVDKSKIVEALQEKYKDTVSCE